MDNLRNGVTNSFQIQHWMEMHQESTTAPEFKWSILDSYKDALRRQLCEGLYILESGSLNRKHEFNRNLICRMEATLDSHLSDSQLKREIEDRKQYKDRVKNFIEKMSVMSDDINLCKGKKNQTKCDIFYAENETAPPKKIFIISFFQILDCWS